MHPFLTFGRLHIPVYGLFAAAGLMAAILLSERTARMAHVDPTALWNAAVVTVVSAFVSSRLLLVLANYRSFLQYPLLVLSLPSLTRLGLLLTAVIGIGYVRHKRMPVRLTLDAAAPCIALLWAALSLGLLAEGTREGMPTTLPWGFASALGKVHPVEAYSAASALVLCAALLLRLRASHHAAGQVAAEALIAAGLLNVALDFFRLPSELFPESRPDAWLDPIQWLGVLLIFAGGSLLAVGLQPPNPSPHTSKPEGPQAPS